MQYLRAAACLCRGAAAGAGGLPCVPRPPALYLHHPRSLPMRSEPRAPLLIAPDPRQPGALGLRRGPLAGGRGPFPASKGARSWCGICKHRCLHSPVPRCFARAPIPPRREEGQAQAPPWPQQPQDGAGAMVRGGRIPLPCLMQQHLAVAEPAGSPPLRCTCTRCSGAEGNRFPSVSSAAAEP